MEFRIQKRTETTPSLSTLDTTPKSAPHNCTDAIYPRLLRSRRTPTLLHVTPRDVSERMCQTSLIVPRESILVIILGGILCYGVGRLADLTIDSTSCTKRLSITPAKSWWNEEEGISKIERELGTKIARSLD